MMMQIRFKLASQAGQVWMDDPSQGIAGEWDEGEFLITDGFNGIINDNSLTLGEDAAAAENAFGNYDILNSDSSNNIVDSSGAISLSVEDNSPG